MNSLQRFIAKVFGIQETIDWFVKDNANLDKLANKRYVEVVQLYGKIDALEGENENLRRTNEILSMTNRDLIAAAKERNMKMEALLGKTAA